MQQTCLVSTINKNYLIAFKVFLKSLLSHNILNLDYIVLIDTSITEKDKNDLKIIYSNLIFKDINTENYNKIKFNGSRAWEFNPAFRLDIFKLPYNKIIYFDVDAVCLKPIDDILNFDYDFAGIEHELHDYDQIKAQYKFNSSTGFNGGLLIIKSKFLNEETINDLKTILTNTEWYGNQGPLNIFFKKFAYLLDRKYFLPSTHTTLTSLKDAYFIHFLGEKKPWFKGEIRDKYSEQVLKCIDTPTIMKLQKLYDSYLNSIEVDKGDGAL